MDNIEDLRNKYKISVDEINLNMKKKYFSYIPLTKIKHKIQSFDDMHDMLYKNNKSYELSHYDLNKNIDIHSDIIKYCKMIFGVKYFDDNDFKCVKSHNDLNYLNPKDGESIIYNSLLKTMFQQTEFRKDVYIFEEKLKNLCEIYNKYNLRINFYEDEEYQPLVWMIIEISNKSE
jgi:hypothetical protein